MATLKTKIKRVLFLQIPLCNRNLGPFPDGLCDTTLGLTLIASSISR